MQSEALFSSDAGLETDRRHHCSYDHVNDAEVSENAGNDSCDSDGHEEGEKSEQHDRREASSSDRRQRWRAARPQKRHKTLTLEEGMLAVHDGMKEIAETFTASRSTAATPVADSNQPILQSLHDLIQSVQAQTNMLV